MASKERTFVVAANQKSTIDALIAKGNDQTAPLRERGLALLKAAERCDMLREMRQDAGGERAS